MCVRGREFRRSAHVMRFLLPASFLSPFLFAPPEDVSFLLCAPPHFLKMLLTFSSLSLSLSLRALAAAASYFFAFPHHHHHHLSLALASPLPSPPPPSPFAHTAVSEDGSFRTTNFASGGECEKTSYAVFMSPSELGSSVAKAEMP